MNKEITCIGCPMGCRITAELDGEKVVSIEGYTCNVGKKYAEEEFTAPKRIVTSLMRVRDGSCPLSVKTSQAIDKSKIFDCLKEIESHCVTLPVQIGSIVIPNVCGTSVNINATKELI